MSEKRRSVPEVMKYVTLGLIIGFVALLMIYRSGSDAPFADVEKAVAAALDQSNLTRQGDQMLKRNFGLNSADYEGVMYYSSEFSMSAEEVLLIKVKDEGQVRAAADAIEDRIATRKAEFEGYVPEEVKMLEDAKLSVRGKYIFFAAAPKADTYLTVFSQSL